MVFKCRAPLPFSLLYCQPVHNKVSVRYSNAPVNRLLILLPCPYLLFVPRTQVQLCFPKVLKTEPPRVPIRVYIPLGSVQTSEVSVSFVPKMNLSYNQVSKHTSRGEPWRGLHSLSPLTPGKRTSVPLSTDTDRRDRLSSWGPLRPPVPTVTHGPPTGIPKKEVTIRRLLVPLFFGRGRVGGTSLNRVPGPGTRGVL